MKTRIIIGVACLVVGGIVGAYCGTWLEGRRNAEHNATEAEATAARVAGFEAEISRLQLRIDQLQMHLRLGRIALEADRKDYGIAEQNASGFFDALGKVAERSTDDPKARRALERVLAARDEIIAGLATGKPAINQRLKDLFLGLFDAPTPRQASELAAPDDDSPGK